MNRAARESSRDSCTKPFLNSIPDRERVALVTGATSGIGLEIARELNRLGYSLILVGRRAERLDELRMEFGERMRTVCADLADAGDVARVAAELELVSGSKSVSVLVNCAGFGTLGRSAELADETGIVEVNALALQVLTQAFLKNRTEGMLLNVSSAAAFVPSPYFAAYAASKSFVYSYTRAIAEELRSEGSAVSATVLCPGPVRTEFDRIAGARERRGLDPAVCAARAVRGMQRGRPVVIPGLSVKLLRIALKILPDGLTVRLARRIQKKKSKT